ncbi:MAG: hypothetical protein ABH881_03390 [bacterium]
MLTYLQKFNNLPDDLRAKISTPEVAENIRKLEEKYGIKLATLIIRVMVKDISTVDLVKYFVFEHNMDGRQAGDIVEDLKEQVFSSVSDYLGFGQDGISRIDEAEDEANKKEKEREALDSWISERRDETEVRGSNFFFSSEDEKEVRELASRLEEYKKEIAEQEEILSTESGPEGSSRVPQATPRKIVRKVDPETIAGIIIEELGINFSSDNLNNRCGEIVKIYLKDVRNKIDTKQTIIKSVDNGGLGLDPVVADQIIAMSDQARKEGVVEALPVDPKKVDLVANKLGGTGSLEVRKTENAQAGVPDRDVGYDFGELIKKKMEETPQKSENGDDMVLNLKKEKESTHEFAPWRKQEDKTNIERVDLSRAPKERLKMAAENVNIKRSPASAGQRMDSPSNGSKVKMQDVKYVPKLTGPIDELREMDREYFNSLSQDPRESANAIKEKLSYLEEENYAKKIEGVGAWRASPLNKLYLEIGQESINSGKGVKAVMEERIAQRSPCLTEEEFNAIMDLNKEIRY